MTPPQHGEGHRLARRLLGDRCAPWTLSASEDDWRYGKPRFVRSL